MTRAAELEALCRAAREAWPDVSLPDEVFVPFVEARLREDRALPAPAIAADLYVACACAEGDARAHAAFERTFTNALDRTLERLGAPADVVAEVKQELRDELFVPAEGRPLGITGYRGRGPLRAWLRVMAVRRTLRALQKRRKSPERGDDALVDLLAAQDSPSIQFAKVEQKAEVVASLREAIEALEPEDRTLLRQQLLEGMTVDQIAASLGIHTVTAARRLAKARARLLSQTRRGAIKRLGIGRAEADSLVRALRSQVDLSLDRLLKSRR